ncbi:transcription factor PAP1-domain-containing protein [Aspergillus falconensis]
MADYNSLYQHGLYLSPDQQDLLLAALSSNNPPSKQKQNAQKPELGSNPSTTPGQASLGSFNASPAFEGSHQFDSLNYDESPFLDFNPELEWDFPGSENLIGDLPGSATSDDHEVGEKRKESNSNGEVHGKKRRESDDKSDDKTSKKPGRKPLTSEPTSKRKAQNRAAQRAFRERKEKHLKDLEAKVEELQKASDNANQENGLLKAQVERLQVELREYRKRLSWVTQGNALSAINSYPGNANRMSGLNNNDFMFDFPKFGDLPGGRIFNGSMAKANLNKKDDTPIPGVLRHSALQAANGRTSSSASPKTVAPNKPATTSPITANEHSTSDNSNFYSYQQQPGQGHDTSTSDSPSSSSDSHQFLSSSGTSPEPSVQSPDNKAKDSHDGHACTIDGEKSFCAQLGMACGNINNPIPAVRQRSESATNTPSAPSITENVPGIDFMAQQNGGQFDPLLFGDWREPQDAVLSQDFNTFFDDAFPLPDLGSPSHNLTEAGLSAQPKKSILEEMDNKEDEEVVPGEDKTQMLTCTKIWDRLQSMEKFRNGEIDVDNLCSELRTKARCSEGGVVVNQRDVDDIIGRV